MPCGDYRGRTESGDHVHFQANQFRCKLGKSVEPSFRPSKFENDVSSLDVSEIPQPLPKGLHERLRWGTGLQHSDMRDLSRRLRLGGEGHEQHAKDQGQGQSSRTQLHCGPPE